VAREVGSRRIALQVQLASNLAWPAVITQCDVTPQTGFAIDEDGPPLPHLFPLQVWNSLFRRPPHSLSVFPCIPPCLSRSASVPLPEGAQHACVCMCVCVCMCACLRACARTCVCVCVCVCACLRVSVGLCVGVRACLCLSRHAYPLSLFHQRRAQPDDSGINVEC
jgi:hypothetical protein